MDNSPDLDTPARYFVGMRYVVIMAGGAGTRLWPLSRQGMPKQLLKLFEDKSLLRIAYERLHGFIPDDRILVCTGAAYADVVAEQLPELPVENILGEPVGRDSLNAVAWSAAVLAHRDSEAVVAMLGADHLIEPVEAFQQSLDVAFNAAEQKPAALVTLGVVPTEPHTGFGYLRRGAELAGLGAWEVTEFKEKPELAVAKQYLESGNYWWNSGMFVWRAATLLDQLSQLKPDTHAAVLRLAEDPQLLAEIYPKLEKISVDYAIMEPAAAGISSGVVISVPLEISWRDVGGYTALAEALGVTENGNISSGAQVSVNCNGCLIINMTDSRAIVGTVGLKNMAVIVSSDVILVANLDDAEKVKTLVARVRDEFGEQYG